MKSWVVCSFLLCSALSSITANLQSSDVQFHLYTRSNPTTSQPLLPTVASIMTSSFSLARPTLIIVHGGMDSVAGNFNAFVVPAKLGAEDVNCVAVDWSRGASTYTVGLSNAPQVGQLIGVFTNLLINSFNYNPNLISVVGHGLGGHIGGMAATYTAGTVAKVTALDPSLVGWTHHTGRLSPAAAAIVEVLHATAGVRGYDEPLGDYDFYPNGGSAQSGCLGDADCSHSMSYVFYAESMQAESNPSSNKFVGRWCDSYEQAAARQCADSESEYTAVFGGTDQPDGPPGVYYMVTNSNSPFATG